MYPRTCEQCLLDQKCWGFHFNNKAPCDCKFSDLTNDPFHRRTKAKQAGGKEEEVADPGTGRPNSESVIHLFTDHFSPHSE